MLAPIHDKLWRPKFKAVASPLAGDGARGEPEAISPMRGRRCYLRKVSARDFEVLRSPQLAHLIARAWGRGVPKQFKLQSFATPSGLAQRSQESLMRYPLTA